MGNQQSSDCCDSPVESEQLSNRSQPLQPEEETQFMNHIIQGCDTQIVFADGSSMPCALMYDLAEDCLHLVVEEKRRVVALSDIQEILEPDNMSGLNQAERAMIINPCIVAFRLGSTKKAILLRFSEVKDSQGFYHFLKEVIRENEGRKDEESAEGEEKPEDAETEEEEQKSSSQTVII